MSDNLVLEHLRIIRADLAEVRRKQAEDSLRLARIESSLAGVRREAAGDAESIAHARVRIDRVQDDVQRINVRLGLIEE